MTFGEIKTNIENKLMNSYTNEKEFKKNILEFKKGILQKKSLSKLYNLYDQLSTPQGMNEGLAKEYLNEGLGLISKLLPEVKTLKLRKGLNENNYRDIDNLVYSSNIDLVERLNSKNRIIQVLTTEKKSLNENVNLPLSSMVNIANQTIKNYLSNLNESEKQEVLNLLSSDSKTLEENYNTLKENTIDRLKSLLSNENDSETKNKITETIDKLKIDKCDHLSYIKLKSLSESL
jgi:hypothetical protein